MAARFKPSYQIRKDFRSTFDPLKHDHHVPHSPLYRPGQEQTMARNVDQSNDDVIPPLPISDEFGNTGNDQLEEEDRTPRLTDRIDPRYGSAKGRREMPPSPFNNDQQGLGRDSKMSTYLNDLKNRDNNHHGNTTAREQYYKPAAKASQSLGYGDRQAFNGGAGFGSYTDRPGYGNTDSFDKPWTQRRYDTPDKMVDPRVGFISGNEMGGPHRLRHGGALLFIRFPVGSFSGQTENIAVASQAFLRSKTHDMGGRFLGLAKTIQDFGYPSGPREAMGVYHFPSPEKALLFFQYDTTIRQPDFPPPYGHSQMWIVSNAYLPDDLESYNTFVLSEVTLHDGRDKREFFEVFQKPFEGYLSKNGALPYVICSYGNHDRQSLRRHAYHRNTIVTCHLYQGINHLRWMGDQEMYQKFRSFSNQMAEEKCMVFVLNRNLCP